jgi:hypothetical protein
MIWPVAVEGMLQMGRWQALIDAVIAALQAETPGAD